MIPRYSSDEDERDTVYSRALSGYAIEGQPIHPMNIIKPNDNAL